MHCQRDGLRAWHVLDQIASLFRFACGRCCALNLSAYACDFAQAIGKPGFDWF